MEVIFMDFIKAKIWTIANKLNELKLISRDMLNVLNIKLQMSHQKMDGSLFPKVKDLKELTLTTGFV